MQGALPLTTTFAGCAAIHHARRLLATALLLLAGFIGPVLAQSLPPTYASAPESAPAAPPPQAASSFTQRGVPATATAENGVLAREKALAAGRRAAWDRVAAEANAPPGNLSDDQIEAMVRSVIIEEERVTNSRYTGRITVNFDPARVQAALGGRMPPATAGASTGGAAEIAAPAARPATTFVDASAGYSTMAEWVELRRRLRGAAQIASMEVMAISSERAQLRLGLRAVAPAVAPELAPAGIIMQPGGDRLGDSWQLRLARGG